VTLEANPLPTGMGPVYVLATRIFRSGITRLYGAPESTFRPRYFVRHWNRTYDSGYIEIPYDKLSEWQRRLA
jgi:hypothetical protein